MKNLLGLFCMLLIINSTFGQLKLKDKATFSGVKMQNTQGESISLNDAKREKGLIVVFSCNTCPFVVGTPDFPGWERQYNDLYALATKNNIGFVVVNSNEGKRANVDSFEEMVKHAQEKGYQMPYLLDEKSELANAFGAKTTPHVFFFNGDMSLIYMGSIDNIWDNKRTSDIPYLPNAIQAQSEGKKLKPNSTPPKGCSIKRLN
ncbi:MAG: thioredoxin family protein [Flavobacteriales bacterium]|nr:thioredoxin family protein [Crocinitomicaceae bacterium]NBX79724.1 thioredoxin family protein [Flavobacteriales bacterium]NCA20050.1 thioredoxin family protein [Crocinitomicaceae bacterium]